MKKDGGKEVKIEVAKKDDDYVHYTYIFGEINLATYVDIRLHNNSGKRYKKYEFHINSSGGDLPTSFRTYKKILNIKKETVTICEGKCESGALAIFTAGKERLAIAESMFLFHGGHFGGNALKLGDSKKLLRLYNQTFNSLCRRMAKISNKPFKFWKDIVDSGEEFYFNGLEAKKMGIVTKLI